MRRVAWQTRVLAATGSGEGGYILRVDYKAAIWAEKVIISSLPYQVNGSNIGAQTVFGVQTDRMYVLGAVLYSLQCPADKANTVLDVSVVSDAVAAAFEVPR